MATPVSAGLFEYACSLYVLQMKVARHSQAQLSFPGLDPTPTDRLFFAVCPDAQAAADTTQIVKGLCEQFGLKSQPLGRDRLHVSLCCLGDFAGLPDGLVAQARRAAEEVVEESVPVTFDRAGTFAHGRKRKSALVLLNDLPLIPLLEFQHALGRAMARNGLGCRVPPYLTPHMTLLYDTRHVEMRPVGPVEWTAREFVLVHSLLGQGKHIPLGRWPLAA
ncbi:2'-5' RNA ligase family protein [Aquabacter sp. CN5-332]|uniref:2'-5' RNA ligase family protein n=1 Tax=Aquabacter sp. CN5-332 TaxID=3156608 RepID=UPI0032B44B26